MDLFKHKEVTYMKEVTTAGLSLGIALSVATAAPLAKEIDWQMALTVFALPGVVGLPVSYTHLTLPTICSV